MAKKVSDENVEGVRQSFVGCPKTSIRTASTHLQIPRSTVHKVLHENLRLYAFKVQLLHAVKPNYKRKRKVFAVRILDQIPNDDAFLNWVCFYDEATSHVSGKINAHYKRARGSENPHVRWELERDSPKVNVWCGLTCSGFNGPFFFVKKSITARV